MGLDQHQLREAFGHAPVADRFEDAYSLATALRDCILPDGYVPSDALIDAITLTSYGEETLLNAPHDGVPEREVRVALFGIFGFSKLFVDIDRLDADALAAAASVEIASGRIRYPYKYGRDLYDSYYETLPHSPRVVDHEIAWGLLEKTGQGVFQLGRWVTGPFGLLRSSTKRLAPPSAQVPLTHCSIPRATRFTT